ncbi:hypothetical protein L7F22_042029 [Adiantum nelumboides]|nr:hypothetical protein [Adiantum nelumboides]
MVILERTPPRKWQSEGSDQEIGEGKHEFVGGLNGVPSTISAQPRKSYVFPSLEDMAAPIREQRAAQQANGHSSASSSASPSTTKQVSHSSTSVRQNSPTQSQRQHSSKIPVHRTMRSSGSPQKKSVSPIAVRKNVDENSASKHASMNKVGSPSRIATSSREAAVDAAFQEQIERAIASGENPFMDKRRAAMRDDSNASITSTPNALYPPLPSKRPSTARQSDSRTQIAVEHDTRDKTISGKQIDSDFVVEKHEPANIPRRSQEEVQRAAATIRKSLLSEEEQKAPATSAIQQHVITNGDQSTHPPSPPIETFTPHRRKLTKEAHAVPIIQQEELHRLRSELRECKALLRDSQLENERLQQECQDNKAQHDDEKRKNQTIEAQMKHLELVAIENECKLKETRWEATQNALRDAMERDEKMRKKNIEVVLAKNKISRLRARALDAEHSFDKLKSKQGKHDEKVHQQKGELEEEVERLRSERQDLKAHLKDVEEKYKEYKEQVNSHADQMEALENAVATEKARRKEISSREAALRGEVQELQKVAAREAKLRAELAEVRADLSSERMTINDLRREAKHSKVSASPSKKVAANSPLQIVSWKDFRNAMTQEAESSFDRSLDVEVDPLPPLKQKALPIKQNRSEPVRAKEVKTKTTSKAKKAQMIEDEESQDEFERTQSPVRKTKTATTRPKAQPVTRAKARGKEVEVVEDEEEEEEVSEPESPVQEQVPASPVRMGRKASPEKKRTVTKQAAEDADMEEASEIPQQDSIQSFIPTMKTTKKSILNKGRAAPPKAKPITVGTSSRSQMQSDAGDLSGATSKINKSKEAIIPPASLHDETMKTPLLPSKRTRAVQNRQAEVEEEEEIIQANKAQKATSKLKTVPVKLAPPPLGDVGNMSVGGVTKTPMVQKNTAAEPRKKKRKLLKAGANVAGDFLNWKGDADGALNPELNLPMELSPLKQGEESRPGNGLNIPTGDAQRVFGRRK